MVQLAEQNNVPMDKLTLGQLKEADLRFGEDVQSCLDYERAVELKGATGGTSKGAVREQTAVLKKILGASS